MESPDAPVAESADVPVGEGAEAAVGARADAASTEEGGGRADSFLARIRAAIAAAAAPVGGLLAGIGRAAAPAVGVLARIPAAIGRGWGAFWSRLSVQARRRLLAAVGAVIALVLFFALAVPNLPCQAPGGDACPPDDDAEELVPGDALAYVHANLDPEAPAYEDLTDLAGRLPIFTGQIASRALALVPGPGGSAPDFERDLAPWFGGELAIAVLPQPLGAPEQVELLEVADTEGATRFATEIAGGTAVPEEYRGIEIQIDRRELATAQIEGFLAIGTRDGVRAVIDTATGAEGSSSLGADELAEELRDELPEQRFAEAFLPAGGVSELIAASGGPFESLAPLIAPGASRGAAIGLAAEDGTLELAVRSELDPERGDASPAFFAAFPQFDPELPGRLGADALGYVGIGDPGTTVTALLAQASAQAPAIATGFEDLVASLRREGEVDIEAELLPALGDEAAFALEPRPEEGEALAAPLPYLEFVADDVDEDGARRALAGLQAPLAESVDPASDLQAPVFGQGEVAGVETRSMRISPTVELVFAVFEGLAVIATDPEAVAGLAEGEGGLDDSQRFEDATEGFEEEVSLLAYFDLSSLVALGERLGLAEDPVYATFAPEFRSLDALGVAVSSDSELLATDARLLISD